MGGPCRILNDKGKKVSAPPCTDNFQVRPFIYEGNQYYSCEHAFQAAKSSHDEKDLQHMLNLVPRRDESDSSHGMRCWSEGRRTRSFRPDFDANKILIMLAVNRAKYQQHEDLRNELLSTGHAEIFGSPSTSWRFNGVDHNWSSWNGLIQMLIREEIRKESDRDQELLENLYTKIDEYNKSDKSVCRLSFPGKQPSLKSLREEEELGNEEKMDFKLSDDGVVGIGGAEE
jgi:predicted NAD-dependent protein-ADP-ribosyltransferase YbiA (DUF1768 family)